MRLIDLDDVLIQLRELKNDHRHNIVIVSSEEDAWKIGIEDCIDILLRSQEVEQSEDAVSREEILKRQHPTSTTLNYFKPFYVVDVNVIKSLPSVTPQPKKGKWIENGYVCYCSRCGETIWNSNKSKYCPECGSYNEEGDNK